MAKRYIEEVSKRRTKAPEFLMKFYEREGTREARSLHKALNVVTNTGLRHMDRIMLKQVGLPIIREAKARMRILEQAGLTDSPAYRFVKNSGVSLSTGGKDDKKIKHNIRIAYDFLHTKTSLVENSLVHNDWLDDHLGVMTTKEERENIFDAVHKFENTHPEHFVNFGYDEAIRKIAQVSSIYGYQLDEILSAEKTMEEKDRVVTNKVGEYLRNKGYLGVDKLKEFLESESDKIDIENLTGVELFEGERSAWYKGRASMKGF